MKIKNYNENIINYQPISLISNDNVHEWAKKREKGALLPYIKRERGFYVPQIDLWEGERILYNFKNIYGNYEEKVEKKISPFRMSPKGWNVSFTSERFFATIEKANTLSGFFLTLPFRKRKARKEAEIYGIHLPYSLLTAIVIRYNLDMQCQHIALVFKQRKIYEESTKKAGRIVLGKMDYFYTFWMIEPRKKNHIEKFSKNVARSAHNLQLKLLNKLVTLQIIDSDQLIKRKEELINLYKQGFKKSEKKDSKLKKSYILKTIMLEGLSVPIFPRKDFRSKPILI